MVIRLEHVVHRKVVKYVTVHYGFSIITSKEYEFI